MLLSDDQFATLFLIIMHVNAWVCLPGKRELAKHLEGMQASLSLRDEAVQRGEIQNRILSEELAKMKNSQQITETEAKALQVNTFYTNTKIVYKIEHNSEIPLFSLKASQK